MSVSITSTVAFPFTCTATITGPATITITVAFPFTCTATITWAGHDHDHGCAAPARQRWQR